ncbi:PREDICTED: E3 ubiquitin-protein ligase RNF8-like [Dinoponera quadriceps]|uniref:E3 ubiquitin-protein ligase CHFR n=1 Tax=Dinoponera quadriceps TaxID=609295 RepID=A0A6P3XW54_DINQU|nr:PREDICTED: E3 ubiquitin-protein ligase RNF8-like [Dinoponera quadriceps]
MERAKRSTANEAEPGILEPLLTRVDQQELIYIDKNEFRIGRAKDNDEIILDVTISRRHCVFRCEGQGDWTVKDFSSSSTFVNGVAVQPGGAQRVNPGDIVQFGCNEMYKYVFSFAGRGHCVKKPRLDEKVLDTMLTKQRTFAESQECQRKELKDRLEIKHKEQAMLRQQLEELMMQQVAAMDDKENLMRQITVLEGKIEAGNAQEQNLQSMYTELLWKLENERLQFELRINEEKQKWQEALEMSKQEKEMVEVNMKEQMESWREQQQAEWRSMMESKVNAEKTIQAQLLNEKNRLEEKLKETQKALKEQEAKAKTSQAILHANAAAESTVSPSNNCIYVELVDVNQGSEFHVLDTIDLTGFGQNIETNTKEGVFEKVSGIMDEQLTCIICSELFVKATTLNCTHTFCHHCINMWCRKRRECPVCRKPVMSMNRSLVLDNFIESMIENLPTELQNRRKEILQERKVTETKKKRR